MRTSSRGCGSTAAGSATNTFSQGGAARARPDRGPPRGNAAVKGLAIVSAKDNGFAAGADIEEFTKLA
jgi:hypothetical protein